MSSATSALGAASEDRKARLAQLKNLKRKQPVDEVATPEGERAQSPPSENPDVSSLHLSGRNYDAETRGPKLGFEAPPLLDLDKPTLEEQAADLSKTVAQQAEQDAADDKGIDIFKLQPKKPNWDLKRNLEEKTRELKVRTDNAINKILRERIEKAQKEAQHQDTPETTTAKVDGEGAGVDGVALVEGLRAREQQEEAEERREREEDAAMGVA